MRLRRRHCADVHAAAISLAADAMPAPPAASADTAIRRLRLSHAPPERLRHYARLIHLALILCAPPSVRHAADAARCRTPPPAFAASCCLPLPCHAFAIR